MPANISNDLKLMLDSLRVENGLANLSRLSGGLFKSIYDVTIDNMCDFNLRNYQYMLYHMTRNVYEKNITLASVSAGINAYDNGDGSNWATTPQRPSYTDGNNYIDYVEGEKQSTVDGKLVTRVDAPDSPLYQTNNVYFDLRDDFKFDSDDEQTGSAPLKTTGNAWTDANSLLYKTKQLWKNNKLKTIISEFHTDPNIKYTGQARTIFGESHGRNLLTKEAELNPDSSGYVTNGYNNPYCRVWTHHHRYEKFKNGMRAYGDNLAYWGSSFEWTEDEKKNKETREAEYIDGEKYDYAWRGRHNQDRKRANTVLDYETGLVNIAPKYMQGQGSNIHTKSCMFSIENLAWKDYDPYSFEKALSWEQRGPMGGRIMWFPPYGLTVNETSNVNWNSNEFIGRGEKVYTYVNSERTGNLSFIMLTDHPSSTDYASWYEDADGLNPDNDYLRYFAGCNEGKVADTDFKKANLTGSEKGTSDEKYNNDMLIKRPPYLTDEYPNDEGTTVIIPKEVEEDIPEPPDDSAKVVEFFVFYPNNYSGYYDTPNVETSQVDAIAYLLAGTGAQKTFSGGSLKGVKLTSDVPISVYNFSTTDAVGYEMTSKPVTPDNYATVGNYIVGSNNNNKENYYNPTNSKQWKYRIDAEPDGSDKYTVKHLTTSNCISQKLYNPKGAVTPNNLNYLDDISYFYNFKISENHNILAAHKDSIYSFAEVAAAFYSEKVANVPSIYNYLTGLSGIDIEKVNRVIELFSNEELNVSVEIQGIANGHGYNPKKNTNIDRNKTLAEQRGETVGRWLKTYSKWSDLSVGYRDADVIGYPNDNRGYPVPEKHNENCPYAKLYRCAHVVMTFSSVKVESENKTKFEEYDRMFQPVSPNENGSAPNFYSLVYPSKKVDRAYVYLSTPPADWETNFGSYYSIMAAAYNLPDVQIIDKRINDDLMTSSYKEYVGFTYVKTERHNNQVWNYYQKNNEKQYFQQVNLSNNSNGYKPVPTEEGITVTEDQVVGLYETFRNSVEPYGNAFEKKNIKHIFDNCPDYDTRGGYEKGNYIEPYKIDDYVKYQSNYYKSRINFADVYENEWLTAGGWYEIDYSEYAQNFIQYVVGKEVSTPDGDFNTVVCSFSVGDIWGFIDSENIVVCKFNFEDEFESVDVGDIPSGTNVVIYDISDNYHRGDYVIIDYGGDEQYFRATKNIRQNDGSHFDIVSAVDYVKENEDEIFGDSLICVNNSEYFYPGYDYNVDNVTKVHNGDDYKIYIKTLSENNISKSFTNNDWELLNETELYDIIVNFPATKILEKGAEILGYTKETLYVNKVLGAESTSGSNIQYDRPSDDFECTWNYGSFNDYYNNSTVTTETDLGELSVDTVRNNYGVYTDQEKNYLTVLSMDSQYVDYQSLANIMTYYISAYRLLSSIRYIKMENGNTRDTLTGKTDTLEDMELKKEHMPSSECTSNLWVDTGDGRLIQECYLNRLKPDDNNYYSNERKDELNKLRYDQEYMFYKRYMAEHPFVFEKLQEKIQYFEPAFHSMTPEGFNARLTFLQQCTRQGKTKTMSDEGGRTANNLAFGRPPFCVLRLGDFYNQLIVIDNISYDYSVSDGLQWDLNAEGNGVQPMLAKVNISFKFIGGGDITGPVRRLQDAMSFNYYANTSFYDNRADRVEYQDTNYKTMGGGGNNKVNYDKSYTYQPDMYLPDEDKNIYLKTK